MKPSDVRRSGRGLLILATASVAFLPVSSALAQCAMCQGGADATPGDFAYSKSTLFMLSVPYVLILGVAAYVFYAFHRSPMTSGSPDDLDPAPPSAESDAPQASGLSPSGPA